MDEQLKFSSTLLNAKELAQKIGIGYTTLFKIQKQKNKAGEPFPYHQLGGHSRKYYVAAEVEQWLLN